ncbi:NAD-dependent epimerase/dehydratase family protein [Actinoallomurus vinaceus]|uniref:NAD-dependent epimerase/dehydratase family protein n=1 Tax=Actinoallomurus vinaceus TaxID=1080074 RepID=UPI003CD0895D
MILVTGAGGAVGSALLETLHAAGHSVRAAYHAQRDVDRVVAAGPPCSSVACPRTTPTP